MCNVMQLNSVHVHTEGMHTDVLKMKSSTSKTKEFEGNNNGMESYSDYAFYFCTLPLTHLVRLCSFHSCFKACEKGNDYYFFPTISLDFTLDFTRFTRFHLFLL